MTAARLVLDRIAPPCRDPRVCLPVPPLQSAGELPRILSFLLAAAASGEVTPGEAEKLARLTGEYGKAVELSESRSAAAIALLGSAGLAPAHQENRHMGAVPRVLLPNARFLRFRPYDLPVLLCHPGHSSLGHEMVVAGPRRGLGTSHTGSQW